MLSKPVNSEHCEHGAEFGLDTGLFERRDLGHPVIERRMERADSALKMRRVPTEFPESMMRPAAIDLGREPKVRRAAAGQFGGRGIVAIAGFLEHGGVESEAAAGEQQVAEIELSKNPFARVPRAVQLRKGGAEDGGSFVEVRLIFGTLPE